MLAMDYSDVGSILGTIALIGFVLEKIYIIVNHKRVTSKCCDKEVSASLDISNTTPPLQIQVQGGGINSKIKKHPPLQFKKIGRVGSEMICDSIKMGITTDKIMELTAKSCGMVIVRNNGNHKYGLKMKGFPKSPKFTIFVDEKDGCKMYFSDQSDSNLQIQERFNQIASDLLKEEYE